MFLVWIYWEFGLSVFGLNGTHLFFDTNYLHRCWLTEDWGPPTQKGEDDAFGVLGSGPLTSRTSFQFCKHFQTETWGLSGHKLMSWRPWEELANFRPGPPLKKIMDGTHIKGVCSPVEGTSVFKVQVVFFSFESEIHCFLFGCSGPRV